MNRPLQWTIAAALMLAAMPDGHPRAVQQTTTQKPAVPPPLPANVVKGEFANSIVYPGTWREYWVYVPPELDRSKPAPVMVFQDGLQYGAPAVFDDLIQKKLLPPLVGVFVMHGRVRAPSALSTAGAVAGVASTVASGVAASVVVSSGVCSLTAPPHPRRTHPSARPSVPHAPPRGRAPERS